MPTFTLSDLQTRVYDKLDSNTLLYPAAGVTRAINEAIKVLNLYIGFIQTSVQMPGWSVANRYKYTTPSPILIPLKVQFEGRELEQFTLSNLARKYRAWATDTTLFRGPVERWAPIGLTRFVIHPADHRGGMDLSVMGVAEPTPLAAAGDVVQLENEFVMLLTDYASHRLQLKEGGKVFADSSLSYQSFLSTMKTRKRFQELKMPRYWILKAATPQ